MKDTWQLQVDLFCWKMCKFYVDRYFARRPLLVVWRCFQHLSLPLRFFKIPSSPFFIQITSRGMKSNECVSYLDIVAVYSSLIDWTLLEWGSYKKTKLSLASWDHSWKGNITFFLTSIFLKQIIHSTRLSLW